MNCIFMRTMMYCTSKGSYVAYQTVFSTGESMPPKTLKTHTCRNRTYCQNFKYEKKAVVLLLSLFLTTFGFAAEYDFASWKPKIYLLENAEKIDQRCEYVKNPETGAMSLQLKWNAIKYNWIQFDFPEADRIPLPDVQNLIVEVNGCCSIPCPVKFINLRVIDKNGEIFQFRQKVDWSKKGKWSVRYSIDNNYMDIYKNSMLGIWGGDKNKEMDKPLKILGVSIDFQKNTGNGEIYIDSIIILDPDVNRKEKKTISSSFKIDFMDKSVLDALRDYKAKVKVNDDRISLEWDTDTNKFGIAFCTDRLGSWCTAPKLPVFIGSVFNINYSLNNGDSKIDRMEVTLVDKKGEFHIWRTTGKIEDRKEGTAEITINSYDEKSKKIEQPFRLARITFYPKSGSSGVLNINSLSLSGEMEVTDAFELEVETGNEAHILEPGKENNLKIFLKNRMADEIKIKAEVALDDFNSKEKVLISPEIYQFKPNETKSLPIPANALNEKSIYYIKCKLSVPDDDKDCKELSRSIVYMKPVGPTSWNRRDEKFLFGINSHPERSPSQIAREAYAISQVGAKIMRTSLGRNPDLNVLDKIVNTFSKDGVNFDLILSYIGKDKNKFSPDFEKSREYYRKLFTRYKGKVDYWELMNEPDIHPAPKPEEYAKIAEIAREELNKIDPGAKLMSAGFCAYDHSIYGKYQINVMRECKNIFAIHCVHGHAPFKMYSDVTLDKLLLPMRKSLNITIPWYANETALSSANRTEKEQAEALYKKLLFAWSRGTIGYNWYNLRNKGEDELNNEYNFGMFTMDFYPKAVYQAFNTVASLFSKSIFVRQLHLPDGFYAFQFKSGNDIILGAWSENSSQYPIFIKTDCQNAELIDLMGNATPIKPNNNLLALTCGEEIKTLRLKDTKNIEILPPAIKIDLPDTIMPGETYPVVCTLQNILEKPQQCSLKITAPSFIKIDKPEDNFEIPERASKKWESSFKVDNDFTINNGMYVPIMVEYHVNGNQPVNTIRSIQTAIPFKPSSSGQPLFEMKDKNQTTGLYDIIEPTNYKMHWRSPEDLSARIWFDTDEKNLLINVDVRDDIHCQTFEGSKYEEGDSVMITLKTKEMAFPCEVCLYSDNAAGKIFVKYTPPESGIDKEKLTRAISFQFNRLEDSSKYTIAIPFDALNTSLESLKTDGFRFNILVNDNDGHGRKGWMNLAPGIGLGGINYTRHPLLIIR